VEKTFFLESGLLWTLALVNEARKMMKDARNKKNNDGEFARDSFSVRKNHKLPDSQFARTAIYLLYQVEIAALIRIGQNLKAPSMKAPETLLILLIAAIIAWILWKGGGPGRTPGLAKESVQLIAFPSRNRKKVA